MSEEKRKASVFIAVLTQAEREGWYSPQLVTFLAAVKIVHDRNVQVTFQHDARPFDYARNLAAAAFLASGLDWLLMVDNDMAPPRNLLDLLDHVDERIDIAVPLFYTMGDAGIKLCWKLKPDCPTATGEWTEIEGAGSG